jgi:hypothetical protein
MLLRLYGFFDGASGPGLLFCLVLLSFQMAVANESEQRIAQPDFSMYHSRYGLLVCRTRGLSLAPTKNSPF